MDVIIHHVELSLFMGSQPAYVITIEDPRFVDETGGGAVGVMVSLMPTEIFESRAAEYDIDVTKPGGWDDLIDLVFASSHGAEQSLYAELADPDFLFNAPTVAHARKAKLRAIRKARGTGKVRGLTGEAVHRGVLDNATGVGNSGAEDPIEFIKRTAPMSPEHIKVKQEYTRRRRNLIRVRREGRTATELVEMVDGVDDQVKRDMKMRTRETPEEMARRLLGDLPEEYREAKLPPRSGTPSKYL